MEPRGGNEPPHVHGVVHGRRFRFCYSTRHIKHHHKMMLCPAYIGHLWSHREESNLQPTDYKTVALPVELRWHIPPPLLSPRRNAAVNTAAGVVCFPLRLSRPSLGGDIMISHSQGSFQRDSAGSYRPTQASGFHGWERPNIAGGLSCTAWRSPCFWLLHIGGFRLYTLRRAQPLSMCRHTGAGHSCHRFRLHDRRASCPFSGAVRRSRLPGIVSFHCHLPHGGRDPPPSLSGGFQPCGILHTVGAATAPPPPHPCEGGRGVNKSGSAGAYAPTLPFSHIPCSPIPSRGNHSNFFCEIMKSYIAFGSSVLPSK